MSLESSPEAMGWFYNEHSYGSYGESPRFMGKSTISVSIFNETVTHVLRLVAIVKAGGLSHEHFPVELQTRTLSAMAMHVPDGMAQKKDGNHNGRLRQ